MTEQTPQQIPHELMLAQVRAAWLRAKLAQVEIESIGIALAANWIDAECALAWAHDADVLQFFLAPPNDTVAAP